MRVLVTGASGFVGYPLCNRLVAEGIEVLAFSRRECVWSPTITSLQSDSLSSFLKSTNSLSNVDCILHLAGRAHVMSEFKANSLAEFRLVNVDETIQLARFAALSGVRRFVFISSIKVNGEYSTIDFPFTAIDKPQPSDAYGISKYEAELALRQIEVETGMEVLIVRPPLIYGKNVKGNFRFLINAISRGIPLPLGSIQQNRRSLISLENLIDFLITLIYSPTGSYRTFLVSDQEDVSTTDLLRRLYNAMGKQSRLISVSQKLLFLASKATGRQSIYQRLCGSLVVDSFATTELIGWKPALSLNDGLCLAVDGYNP